MPRLFVNTRPSSAPWFSTPKLLRTPCTGAGEGFGAVVEADDERQRLRASGTVCANPSRGTITAVLEGRPSAWCARSPSGPTRRPCPRCARSRCRPRARPPADGRCRVRGPARRRLLAMWPNDRRPGERRQPGPYIAHSSQKLGRTRTASCQSRWNRVRQGMSAPGRRAEGSVPRRLPRAATRHELRGADGGDQERDAEREEGALDPVRPGSSAFGERGYVDARDAEASDHDAGRRARRRVSGNHFAAAGNVDTNAIAMPAPSGRRNPRMSGSPRAGPAIGTRSVRRRHEHASRRRHGAARCVLHAPANAVDQREHRDRDRVREGSPAPALHPHSPESRLREDAPRVPAPEREVDRRSRRTSRPSHARAPPRVSACIGPCPRMTPPDAPSAMRRCSYPVIAAEVIGSPECRARLVPSDVRLVR